MHICVGICIIVRSLFYGLADPDLLADTPLFHRDRGRESPASRSSRAILPDGILPRIHQFRTFHKAVFRSLDSGFIIQSGTHKCPFHGFIISRCTHGIARLPVSRQPCHILLCQHNLLRARQHQLKFILLCRVILVNCSVKIGIAALCMPDIFLYLRSDLRPVSIVFPGLTRHSFFYILDFWNPVPGCVKRCLARFVIHVFCNTTGYETAICIHCCVRDKKRRYPEWSKSSRSVSS